MTQLLFIPYQQDDSDSKDGTGEEGGTSWQKHASREYHRKNKLRKAASARQARTRFQSVRLYSKSKDRTLAPRNGDQQDISTLMCTTNQQSPVLMNVGGGLLDPFGTAVPSDKPRYAIEMLDHAISQQWPAFDAGSGPNGIKQTILSCAMLSPTAFYAVVFAAASHAAFNYVGMEVPVENTILRMSYKGLAISHLKQEISSLSGPVPEELLLGMITLAAHGYGELLVPPRSDSCKLKGPLALGQHSQFYGEIRWEPTHLIALVSMIQERGGLKTLKMPGLAESIKLSDNLEAFKGLRPPVFPLLMPIEQVMSYWSATQSDCRLIFAHRNSNVDKLPDHIRKHPLLKTIRYLPTVLTSYEDYLNRRRDCAPLVQLLAARNCILHELLTHDPSLDTSPLNHSPGSYYSEAYSGEEQTGSPNLPTLDEHLLLILIRFVALAFMLLVLFPLPRVTGVHTMLTIELMRAIDQCDEAGEWETHPELLLYATVMGGAVADKLSRTYFVQKFLQWEKTWVVRQYSKSSTIEMNEEELWTHVKSICTAWLWYDGPYSDLEIGASSFWLDVLQQRRAAKSCSRSKV